MLLSKKQIVLKTRQGYNKIPRLRTYIFEVCTISSFMLEVVVNYQKK